MKPAILLLFAATVLPLFAAPTSKNCGCECCRGKEVCCCKVPATLLAEKCHPLRGVITAIHADRSSLMVKHEQIPGVMRAMTMLFRVDEATVKSAQKSRTITARMSRRDGEWWLHDVQVEPQRSGDQ